MLPDPATHRPCGRAPWWRIEAQRVVDAYAGCVSAVAAPMPPPRALAHTAAAAAADTAAYDSLAHVAELAAEVAQWASGPADGRAGDSHALPSQRVQTLRRAADVLRGSSLRAHAHDAASQPGAVWRGLLALLAGDLCARGVLPALLDGPAAWIEEAALAQLAARGRAAQLLPREHAVDFLRAAHARAVDEYRVRVRRVHDDARPLAAQVLAACEQAPRRHARACRALATWASFASGWADGSPAAHQPAGVDRAGAGGGGGGGGDDGDSAGDGVHALGDVLRAAHALARLSTAQLRQLVHALLLSTVVTPSAVLYAACSGGGGVAGV